MSLEYPERLPGPLPRPFMGLARSMLCSRKAFASFPKGFLGLLGLPKGLSGLTERLLGHQVWPNHVVQNQYHRQQLMEFSSNQANNMCSPDAPPLSPLGSTRTGGISTACKKCAAVNGCTNTTSTGTRWDDI
eukprot:3869080-Pyramimonas_sp.AAC.1